MKPFAKGQPLSRRAVLRGAGGVAIGLPLLEAMAGVRPAAAQAALPRRVLFFFWPHGLSGLVAPRNWDPVGTETDFTLSTILQPLASHKQDIVVLRGLGYSAVGLSDMLPPDGHIAGRVGALTGRVVRDKDRDYASPDGPSVDQEIAKAMVGKTRFKSLEVGVYPIQHSITSANTLSWLGYRQPVPVERRLDVIFDRLFGMPSTGATDDGSLARLARQRKSVLDAVKTQIGRLSSKLGSEDRQKLDAHLAAVRNVEAQLTAAPAPARLGGSCRSPTRPAIFPLVTTTDHTRVQEATQVLLDMIVLAFQCDLTRVVTLDHSGDANRYDLHMPWLGVSTTGWHTISHSNASADVDAQHKLPQWYAGQMASLMSKLKAVPEGTGTMLDNTLIVLLTEVGSGNLHNRSNMPIVLGGRAGGALRTGRWLKAAAGSSNNDLWAWVMNNAMGIPTTSFGTPEFCRGPLAGLS